MLKTEKNVKKIVKSCDEHFICVSELSEENNLSLVDRRGLLEHLIRCSLQSKGQKISKGKFWCLSFKDFCPKKRLNEKNKGNLFQYSVVSIKQTGSNKRTGWSKNFI